MSDLADLSAVAGEDLNEEQIKGILAQIDLDIVNFTRDGKLAGARYTVPGAAGRWVDRGVSLEGLLAAREYYRKLLESLPACEVSRAAE